LQCSYKNCFKARKQLLIIFFGPSTLKLGFFGTTVDLQQ